MDTTQAWIVGGPDFARAKAIRAPRAKGSTPPYEEYGWFDLEKCRVLCAKMEWWLVVLINPAAPDPSLTLTIVNAGGVWIDPSSESKQELFDKVKGSPAYAGIDR
jgi:hypothetical protein